MNEPTMTKQNLTSKAKRDLKRKLNPKITASVEIITPKMANEWLKHNVGHNRKVRRKQVQWLATQMKSGKWLLTHQGIAFDHEGKLQDGQHRLTAILESGSSIEMMVFRGIDPETFKVLDTGKVRTAGDVLYTAGISEYSSVFAYSVRMILAFRAAGGMTHKERHMITNAMVLDFSEKNRDALTQIAAQVHRLATEHGSVIGKSLAVALVWVLGNLKNSNMDTSMDFVEKIYTGADLDAYSPILKLRNWLMNEKKTEVKHTFRLKYSMIIKGWNFYRSDTTVAKIWSWRSDERIPDPY